MSGISKSIFFRFALHIFVISKMYFVLCAFFLYCIYLLTVQGKLNKVTYIINEFMFQLFFIKLFWNVIASIVSDTKCE